MRRRKNPDTNTLLILAALAAGGFVLYQLLKVGSAAATATAGGIANLWVSLTSSSPITVLGNVVLANGAVLGPLSQFQVKTDTLGNVYINTGGVTYQLGQSDANGNWPATPVGT